LFVCSFVCCGLFGSLKLEGKALFVAHTTAREAGGVASVVFCAGRGWLSCVRSSEVGVTSNRVKNLSKSHIYVVV
jgi:hypothetical protein